MVKNNSTGFTPWVMIVLMREMRLNGEGGRLEANSDGSESTNTYLAERPTCFEVVKQNAHVNTLNDVYIYVAIRRPHKPPEAGTDVYTANTAGSNTAFAAGFNVDWAEMAV